MEGKHEFASGATSSEHMTMFHLIPSSFWRRTGLRATIGAVKHGDVNYQKCVRRTVVHDIVAYELDVAFIRDRYNHAFNHLLSFKHETGNNDDDNTGAVAWFCMFRCWLDDLIPGLSWGRLLTPVNVNERTLVFTDCGIEVKP